VLVVRYSEVDEHGEVEESETVHKDPPRNAFDRPPQQPDIPILTSESTPDSPNYVAPPFWIGRPAAIGQGLVGREAELRKIASALDNHRAVVISGGPGCGKSRLAAGYTYRSRERGFWTTAGQNVLQTLASLAPDLGVDLSHHTEDEVGEVVKRHIAALPRVTLWVIDNLSDLNLLNTLLSVAGPLRLLVTSRDRRQYIVPNTVGFQLVDVLEPEPAVELLCSRKDCDRGPLRYL